MKYIKSVIKALTLTAAFASTAAFSSDFLLNTTTIIEDSNNDAVGGTKYEIDKMHVSSVGDLVTVDIYTNFVQYNNRKSANGNKIVFGDLLIGTDGVLGSYDYAFVLTEERNKKITNKVKSWDRDGTLTKIGSTITSSTYNGLSETSTSIGQDQVFADSADASNVNIREGDWSAAQIGGYDLISFSFNVGGIEAFQNASQLAFSWGMSCANDVVKGLVEVTPKSVPEPATILLMLGALAFMANSRKKLND